MLEFFATNGPDSPHLTPNSCFCAFCSIWVHLGSFCYCMQLSANRAELVQLMQKFVQRSRVGIFCKKAPDPYHWTLNSCSSAFCNIWLHLGPFHYCKKQGANRAELVQLMQNFVQRSRIGFFATKAPDPPLDPKLMFWCVS